MTDQLGAFVDHCDIQIEGAVDGPLAQTTFAVKDLYHIAGTKAGCGNPDWLDSHDEDEETAPVIHKLLAAGGTLVGKTHTDEIAYSLNGENHFYGTPVNVNAKGRIPGGSSSGSAAAVAGALCDYALGTDTGGSVRLPASYCGIFGIRPTHGRIPLQGLMALARSFDTIGWFARDPAVLEIVGKVLFDDWSGPAPLQQTLVPVDAWALADPAVQDVLRPIAERLRHLTPIVHEITLVPEGIGSWSPLFRVIQGWEIWQEHRAWVEAENPTFGPGIAERMKWVPTISDADKAEADAGRAKVIDRLNTILQPGTIMVLPTSPGIAPEIGQPAESLESFRYRALQLTGIGSLGKVPQINIPVGQVDGCPVGLSLMAGPGGDELLLDIAGKLAGVAQNGVAPLLV
ncbi:amidase [Hwanghaeella grinnelliae]|uniref:Amidase n=1 Tax=Hwanghaeella grinnelliae TaxID=2500179 RepID=A0A437QTN2_9PROT|nr:amidase [Hwanghaeella grinnelliae]RVU37854.1 amidase [Hwanghaeella grinnelliae]